MEEDVARALGVGRVTIVPVAPGASRGAARVVGPGDRTLAFLRSEIADGAGTAPGLSLWEEAALVRRVGALGFTVPTILAELPRHNAVLMSFAAGDTRLDPASVSRAGPAYMAEIARLHQTPPDALGLPSPATVTEALVADLDRHVAAAGERGLMSDPLMRLSARILRATLPVSDEPPASLHGDVGGGNFMAEEGRLTAILDWELAHAGDIHEDLAWLWVRGAHTDFGTPRERLGDYRLTGRSIDPRRLEWHVAFVTFKTMIGLHSRLAGTGGDPALLPIFIAALAYDTLMGAALGRLAGADITLLAQRAEPQETAHSRLLATLFDLNDTPTRPESILSAYFRTDALLAPWAGARRISDARNFLNVHPDEVDALVDTGDDTLLAPLAHMLAGIADRRCMALPNAQRRVRRALDIGFGGDLHHYLKDVT